MHTTTARTVSQSWTRSHILLTPFVCLPAYPVRLLWCRSYSSQFKFMRTVYSTACLRCCSFALRLDKAALFVNFFFVQFRWTCSNGYGKKGEMYQRRQAVRQRGRQEAMRRTEWNIDGQVKKTARQAERRARKQRRSHMLASIDISPD